MQSSVAGGNQSQTRLIDANNELNTHRGVSLEPGSCCIALVKTFWEGWKRRAHLLICIHWSIYKQLKHRRGVISVHVWKWMDLFWTTLPVCYSLMWVYTKCCHRSCLTGHQMSESAVVPFVLKPDIAVTPMDVLWCDTVLYIHHSRTDSRWLTHRLYTKPVALFYINT